MNRRSAAVSPTLPALLLLRPLGSAPGGSSLVETLCPVPASCCLPYRAAENCLSLLFWPVSIIELCNTPSCGLPALRRSSHGDSRCGTLSQHPRKCDVHPHLWYDLCRWRAACIARMNESLGSDSLYSLLFTLFCLVIRGTFFSFLDSSFHFISLSFCFICRLAPPQMLPPRLLVFVYSQLCIYDG